MAEYVNELAKSNSYQEYQTAFKKAIDTENKYREIFADPSKDPSSTCLSDKYCMLYPIYENDNINNFKYRTLFPEEADITTVFPLTERKTLKDQCISTFDEFKENFDVMTEGMFRTMNWNNIIIAGGSVSACLRPVPKEYNVNRKKLRQYYHEKEYSGVDVDVFIYGLDEEDAKKKMVEIAEAIEGQLIFPVKYFRTTHSITIVSQFPYVNCQLILRLYKSPAEVIMGFDIDSCAVLYNGTQVYCLPRSYNAIISQFNTVDMTRRSPTYESRLSKYASRGYEILVPSLDRSRIDPIIYEKSFDKVQGLSRLLLLEKFSDPESRIRYILEKTQSRGRGLSRLMRKVLDTSYARNQILDIGERISDYSIVFFPCGPQWNAKKIADFLRTKDRLLNASFYTGEDRDYHMHPCFISDTMPGVFRSGCHDCPEFPADLRDDLKEKYVRGEIQFLKENPGQQLIGSFHPITEGDWSEGTYLSEHTHQYMELCLGDDVKLLDDYITQNNININTTDSLGRTALHILSFVNNTKLLPYFLDKKINICATMSDGRSAFHIACIYGHDEFLGMLLKYNQSLPQEERFTLTNLEGAYYLSCLDYSTLFLHPKCVELLFEHGVDPKCVLSEKTDYAKLPTIYLATFASTAYPDRCKEVLQQFISRKITSFTVFFESNSYLTIFQYAIQQNHYVFAKLLLELDPTCVDHFKMLSNCNHILTTPIQNNNVEMFKLLIDYGAQINMTTTQIDAFNKWMKKFPPLKYYGRRQLQIENLNSPLEYLAANNGKESVEKHIEMMNYVLSKNIQIDFSLKHRKNLLLTQNLFNIIEQNKKQIKGYKDQLDGSQTQETMKNMKRARRQNYYYGGNNQLTYLSSKYEEFLLGSSTNYGKFITEKFTEFNTHNEKIEEENLKKQNNNDTIRDSIKNLEELNVVLQQLLDMLIKNGSPKYVVQPETTMTGFNNNVQEQENLNSAQFQIMTESTQRWEGSIAYIPVPEDEKLKYLQFYNAIYEHDIDTITKLSDPKSVEPVLISSRDPLGFTPFMLSTHRGHQDLIPLLIQISMSQYTPNQTIEVKEERRLNNIDLVTGLIDEDAGKEKETVFDPNADFSSILSQISHVDILTSYTMILSNLSDATDSDMEVEDDGGEVPADKSKIMNCQVHYNALSYCLKTKQYTIFNDIIDSIVNSDKFIVEKTKKDIKYNTSGMFNLSMSNPSNNYGYRCGIGRSSRKAVSNSFLTQVLLSNDLQFVRIIAKKLGLCYIAPEQFAPGLSYQCALWIAASYCSNDILDYFLSDEVINDLNEFQANHNPYKEEWEKNDLINKIKVQFNINFGKESFTTEDKSYKYSLGYKPVIYHASLHNNVEVIKHIFELDPNMEKKYITEALEITCNVDNEALTHLLFNHGGLITTQALTTYANQIPNYPNPYKVGDATNTNTSSCFGLGRSMVAQQNQANNYESYEKKYNKSIEEFDKYLQLLTQEYKRQLFDDDKCQLLNIAFTKNSVKLIDVLLKHGYNIKSLNHCYQSIAHINATNYEWHKIMTSYLNDIFSNPDYQSLFNLEDGHGDVPFDIYLNVYLKTLLKKYGNGTTPEKINEFMLSIRPQLNIPRQLTTAEKIRMSLQNSNIVQQGRGFGRGRVGRGMRQRYEEQMEDVYDDGDEEEGFEYGERPIGFIKTPGGPLCITWSTL